MTILLPNIKRFTLAVLCCIITTASYAQIDFQVGTGTTVNPYSQYPSPFPHYFKADKQQYLFPASELLAAGMFPGAILAIKWDVKHLATGALNPYPGSEDLEIKIGSTSVTTLASGYVSGINHVVLPKTTIMPVLGINAFTLPVPFVWNGTDNIVIEVCHGNLVPYTGNCGVEYTVVNGYAAFQYYATDADGSQCATTTFNNSYTDRRPNTIFSMGIPCDSTLDSAVIVGPEHVCPNRKFKLFIGALPDKTVMTGATHQWQYSDDGMSWSNYTGPVNSPNGGEIVDAISETRWYRCAVNCVSTGLSYTTPVKRVDISPFSYCYCINSVREKEGNDIGNVTIMSSNKLDTVFNKASLGSGTGLPVFNNSGANRMYTSYHDSLAAPCLSRDSTYIFHVSQIFSGNLYEHGFIHGFIDFDRDGVYHKTNERVFVKKYDPTAVNPEIVQVAVTVPKDTNFSKLGITGMRLVLSRDSVYVPCDSLDGRGEVEDYLVKICPPPCTGPVDGGIVVSTDSSMCKGYEYTVTDTTYSQNQSAFDRSWQMSGDNINWLNVANSDNKDTLNRTFTGQRIYYRVRTICLPTHDTNYSPSTMVNEKAKFKCYCYSRATGSFGVDTSDIGAFAIADYSNNAGGPHLLNERARKPRTDYTELDPIELFTDSVYRFNVFHSMPVAEHGDAKVTVFIDFNNNHAYDIPQERVYSGFTSIGNHTIIDNVFIPLQAITDMPTGMRVILNNNLGPNVPSDEACGGYLSGETEDYMVILRKKWRAGISGMETEVNGFNVHPNPASGRFWVQFSSGAITGDIKVRVTNVTGQQVQEQSYRHEGGMFYREVDMSGQANGVYFVELQAGDKKMISKLVLQ